MHVHEIPAAKHTGHTFATQTASTPPRKGLRSRLCLSPPSQLGEQAEEHPGAQGQHPVSQRPLASPILRACAAKLLGTLCSHELLLLAREAYSKMPLVQSI